MIEKADCELVADLRPSPNFETRRKVAGPDMLIMHYTGMTCCQKAIDWLSRPESKVSCHYVIDEDGRITQMVAEASRAWHAGASYWAGVHDINSRSVGIEIHNLGHELGYPDFPKAQMDAVEALALGIIKRWNIPPQRVLAHSDVAPLRKGDPGEKFDWPRLATVGIGHWVAPVAADDADAGLTIGAAGAKVKAMRGLLRRYGYGIAAGGVYDEAMQKTVLAFQRHFRPARCDGRLDDSTYTTLERLLAALPDQAPPPVG